MKDSNTRHKLLTFFILTLFSLVLFSSAVQARDVTFTWTANAETVDGYQLYYKSGATGGAPYDGIGAIEGNSPVNTGNVTTFTLSGLSDTETYYFVLTAFTGTLESDYSTELTLPPPPVTTPADVTANFSWLPNPETTVIGYKIHYGTATATYDTIVDVGNPAPIGGRIQAQVPGLIEGTTYYFAATAYDGNGLESDYSTEVIWTATPTTGGGLPPVASDSSYSTTEDQAISGTVSATNDTGLLINYLVQQDVANGVLLLEAGTGTFTYTPQANFSGTDVFTFLARDTNGDSNFATVSLTITAINKPPVAENTVITVNEDSTVSGQLTAQDPDGDILTFTVITNPTSGALTLNTSGAYTYTPAANANGTDSFTFQAGDGQAASNTATVSITINPVNDAPVAQDGSLTAFTGQTTSGTLQASDGDNDPLTYSLIDDPLQVVTITNPATGSYTFTPVDAMTSPYTFTFEANDSTVDSNTAAVTVTVLEAGTTTEIFGDTPDSTHPGTLTDTFTNVNNDINASAENISIWSWSSPTPHKPANTIIIKTDLSALNTNIQITEAKLYLYQNSATGEAEYTNNIHKIIGKNPIIDQTTGYNAFNGEPWTPVATGTTYTDVPLGLTDIGPAEDTVTLDTQPGYQTWLITQMVQDWINDPAGNFGLLISGVPTTIETGRIFAASENQNGSLRPKLVIRYIKKPPKPSVISARKIK